MSRLIDEEVIERNSVRCLSCKDEIESTSRHDFRWCSCGAVAVDGGKDYRRRCWQDGAEFEETSIFETVQREVNW